MWVGKYIFRPSHITTLDNSWNYSIDRCKKERKKWLLKTFFDLYRTELLQHLNILTSERPNDNKWSNLLQILEYRIKFNHNRLLLNIIYPKMICFVDNDVSPTGDNLTFTSYASHFQVKVSKINIIIPFQMCLNIFTKNVLKLFTYDDNS